MLTLNNESRAEKIRMLRLHGISCDAWKRFGKTGFSHWELHALGFKYNMPDINAAIGIHQLKKIDRFFQLRKKYASLYDLAFDQIPELETLETREYADHLTIYI
jgi:dTDP-4-amino-4,6-dideoxygalactose transaminase